MGQMVVAALSVAALLLLSTQHTAGGLAPLEPASGDGAYFGVSIDFSTTTVSQYTSTSTVQPVVYNVFVSIPLNATTSSYLDQVLPEIAAANAVVLLTVEPDQGLAAVTETAISGLATYILEYQQKGASFMIRFAHEMNGNWYVWGQQPSEYIAAFQAVAQGLRNATCGVAMVWAPNSAVGYPWPNATSEGTNLAPPLVPGSKDFELMDTNHDGQITSSDDPFSPYYPGDQYVDWVGMSSFHFGGESFPYNKNQQAAPDAFVSGFSGNQGGYPDFYASYCGDSTHQKPLIITETSAMYNPSDSTGDSDYAIKSNWWQQVFNVQGNSSQGPDMSIYFPMVKAILWFDEIKVEAQAANALIDWRFSGNQQIQSGLAIYIQTPAQNSGQTYWKQLPDYVQSSLAITCDGMKMTGSGSTVSKSQNVTTAAFSAAVPLSAPPTPPAPVVVPGGAAAQSTYQAQQAAVTTTQYQNSFGAGTSIAALLGRRLLNIA